MADIDPSGIDGASAVSEPPIGTVASDHQGTGVDCSASHHRDAGRLTRTPVVIHPDIELIHRRDQAARHAQMPVTAFMAKANPVAGIDRPGADIDRAHAGRSTHTAATDSYEAARIAQR